MRKFVIIVAGGTGKRMGYQVPKQFIEINGFPILMYTIKNFYNYDKSLKIVVGLPENQIDKWGVLCKKKNFTIGHKIIKGGENRFLTVKNCLTALPQNAVVAVHDGVRPFVSHETVEKCFLVATDKGSSIPVIGIKESLRFIHNTENKSVNRNHYKIVQTPQTFHSEILKKSYNSEFKDKFTDDASVVENCGYSIYTVDGNPENIKITTPEDLILAEYYVKTLKL